MKVKENHLGCEKTYDIDVDNLLYMVDSMGGASTSLGGLKIYYVDNNRLHFLNGYIEPHSGCFMGLDDLPEECQGKFVYFAGGMGNFGFANKDAIYLGRDGMNRTLKFKFRGDVYEVKSYLPIEECPIVEEGEELPMENFDLGKFWEEREQQNY